MCLAIPGKIVSFTSQPQDPFRRGRVSFGGIVKDVDLSLVVGIKTGDYVLVHVGVAIATIDEEAAAEIFDELRRMGEIRELDNPENSSI